MISVPMPIYEKSEKVNRSNKLEKKHDPLVPKLINCCCKKIRTFRSVLSMPVYNPRNRFHKKKSVFMFLMLLGSVTTFLVFFKRNPWSSLKFSPLHLPNVVVHLDLKGSPPKISYLKSLLPLLKAYGVNGLLMEYEDMFPYNEELEIVRARNAYTKQDLTRFLTAATNLGFEIIPLVQTFGHLEFVLKFEKFRHLRESDLFPDSLCPNKNESRVLIANMLKQIIDYHKSIAPLKHIHIGCDEVYHLNECSRCRGQVNSNKINTFTKHVEFVKNTVQKFSPSTKVLIWDDMMRGHNGRMNKMNVKSINKNLEPVYWDYSATLRVYHPDIVRYQTSFDNVWVASAFKGADGRVATLPDQDKRIANHVSWLKLITRYGEGYPSYKFKGIILTGWSRVSHLEAPIETLQVSLQTLLLNLILIQKYKKGYSPKKRFINDLITAYDSTLDCNIKTTSMELRCDSDKLLSTFRSLETCRKEAIEHIYGHEYGLYAIEYYKDNVNLNSAPNIVAWASNTKSYLLYLQANARKIMNKAYDNDFVDEYLSLKVHDIVKRLNSILNIVKNCQKRRIWGKRTVIDKNNLNSTSWIRTITNL